MIAAPKVGVFESPTALEWLRAAGVEKVVVNVHYLADALEAKPRIMDLGAQLPHAALRYYVMGDVTARRGRIENIDDRSGQKIIRVVVPLAKLPGPLRTASGRVPHPRGDIDALIFREGPQVVFPPDMAEAVRRIAEAIQAMKQGGDILALGDALDAHARDSGAGECEGLRPGPGAAPPR